jgi:hypothetical protein
MYSFYCFAISILVAIASVQAFTSPKLKPVRAVSLRSTPFSSSEGRGPETTRSFVRYPIYKGKCALAVRPIPPSFSPAGASSRNLDKEGGILVELAPVSGARTYDWSKKATFLLDPTECGSVVSMDITKDTVEFFHDPNMGSEKQGDISKRLQIYKSPDGKAVFVSLYVKDKSDAPKSYVIPLTFPEFYVLRRLIDFSIPRLLGFDCIWGGDNVVANTVTPSGPPAWKVIDPNE